MVKYFILVLTGVLSTSMFYISLMFGVASTQILDAAINLCCVLLMSPLHNKYYNIFCKMCNNKLLRVCTIKMNGKSNSMSPV